MSYLVALSVVSFCSLLWAAFAIARHVRSVAPLPAATAEAETAAPGPGGDSAVR